MVILEIEERLISLDVNEFTNVEVFSCHRLQPSCLRGQIKQFSFARGSKLILCFSFHITVSHRCEFFATLEVEKLILQWVEFHFEFHFL